MNARDFCFWLQGCFEMNPNLNTLDEHQTEMLKQHLHLVFTHEIGPSFGDQDYQDKLKDVHEGHKDVAGPAPVVAPHINDVFQDIPLKEYKPFFPTPLPGLVKRYPSDGILLC